MAKNYFYEVYATDVVDGEDVTPMANRISYYHEIEAINDAISIADSFKNDDRVIEVTVYAGEWEDFNGNVFGEPFDIYTATNVSKEKSKLAREQNNFVKTTGLDYYAGEE